MLLRALLWLTGQLDVDATPRSGPTSPPPAICPDGVRDLAGSNEVFAPGDIITITGARLTSGSFLDSVATPLPLRLAGTHVEVNGTSAPLFSVAPDRVMIQLPTNLTPRQSASVTVSSVNLASSGVPLRIDTAAPAIVGVTRVGDAVVIYVTGLGITNPPLQERLPASATPLLRTTVLPSVSVAGQPATVFFSGLAPGFVGLYQINALLPSNTPTAFEILVGADGRWSQPFRFEP
jgi:hypothetical protein